MRVTRIAASAVLTAGAVLALAAGPAHAARSDVTPIIPESPPIGSIWHGHKVLNVIHADDAAATGATKGSVTVDGTTIAAATTSKNCPAINAAPLVNPLSGNPDGKIFLAISWHAQLTLSGRPEAQMQLGSSAFVKSNHTDGYRFYWNDGIWYDFQYDATRGGNFYGWHRATLPNTVPYLVTGGSSGAVGIYINSNGTASSPWQNATDGLAGNKLRQLIEYYGVHSPAYSIALHDYSRPSLSEETRFVFEVGRDSSGNVTCGNVLVID